MSNNKKNAEKMQIVVFRLDNRHYGAGIEQIREITRIGDISPFPNAPHYVLGVTNRRGQVTTIIDLRRKIGMPDKEIDQHSRMLVVETKTTSTGIVVDAVEDATMLANTDIEETPELAKTTDGTTNYIKGIGKKGQQLIILLDLKALISDASDNIELEANPDVLAPTQQ